MRPKCCDMSPARRHNKNCSGLTELVSKKLDQASSSPFHQQAEATAPKDQAGAWQLIIVNIDRQCSSDISVIAEKLHEPARMRARLPVIFSIQEMRSWNVPDLELPGYACYGLATLMVLDQFFQN